MDATGVRVLALVFCTTVMWCAVGAVLAQETVEPRFRYEAQWQTLTAADNHTDAALLAKTWVNDAIVQFGDGAAETFPPLTHLASSYAASDKRALAINTYRRAIEVGERQLGTFSRSLVGPLVKLGELLQANRQYEEAVSTLARAKNITHRIEGIYNTEQTGIVEKLSDLYLQLDDVQQAGREQRLLYSSNVREVGENSPNIVPALHRRAEFNLKINRHRDARQYLHRAVEVLENAYGPNDVRIVETLNMIAATFLENENSSLPREGLLALRRVVSIYEAQDSVDQADLLGAKTALGDWYIATGRRTLGLETHLEAIAAAREAGFSDALIDEFYAKPRPLTTKARPEDSSRLGLQRYKHTSSAVVIDSLDGSIIFEFDVSERGVPNNIRVVKDTIGRHRLVNMLRTWVALVVYRPKFENGEAVATQGLRREFEF